MSGGISTDIIVTVKATVLTLSTTKVDVKCKGDATGSISITATSGKAPYTYSVTKGGTAVSTTAVTTGLTAGTYDIVITDALGCTSASTAVTITEPAVALSATATARQRQPAVQQLRLLLLDMTEQHLILIVLTQAHLQQQQLMQ